MEISDCNCELCSVPRQQLQHFRLQYDSYTTVLDYTFLSLREKNVSIGGPVHQRALGRQRHRPCQTADPAAVRENRKAGGEKSGLETVIT